MKRTSRKTRPGRQWAFFGSAALTMFLLMISSMASAAQKAAPAGWRVELEEGKTTRSTLTINNRCSAPHLFRVKNKVKYLRFEQATDSILIGANSSKEIGTRFDATGLKSKQYRDKVVVECLDCKKEKTCHQDRDTVPVEMIVRKALIQETPGGSTNKQMAWGLCCSLYGSGGSTNCASPATNCFDEIVIKPGKVFKHWARFNEAVDLNTTATFFSGQEWKPLFPNLDKFPKQIAMLRGGLPLLRFETAESGVVRYLATRQSREQVISQTRGKNSTLISGVEFCLTVRQKP